MAIRDASVIVYSSADVGAPTLNCVAGTLVAVLDAVLVNGYGTVTADSLVVAGGIATLTRSAGHGFTNPGEGQSLDIGTVIEIAGVTGALSGINGRWRATVTSTTVLTWECGLADGTATGTITAKRPPLGWNQIFSATNKAAYQLTELTSNKHCLRVDDTGTGGQHYARIRAYESMSDIDTGVNPFPRDTDASGGYYWVKGPSSGSTTASPWMIIGDVFGFYIRTPPATATLSYNANFFGQINPDKEDDAFHTLCMGGNNTTITQMGALYSIGSDSITHTMPRAYTQTGTTIQCGKKSHGIMSSGLGAGEDTIPSIAGGKYLVAPIDIWESALKIRRGELPGGYAPLHMGTAAVNDRCYDMRGFLEGRILQHWRFQNAGTLYGIGIDVTGPWR